MSYQCLVKLYVYPKDVIMGLIEILFSKIKMTNLNNSKFRTLD